LMKFSKFAPGSQNTPDLGALGPSDCVTAVCLA
jgi:hypothetical protein